MDRPVRLLQFTDTHLLADPAGQLRGVRPFVTLQNTLARAAEDLLAADAVLCTGDLVNDDADGYVHLRRLFGDFARPVMCLPGNHDDGLRMRHALSVPPFQVGGHADFGSWRIIMLDSTVAGQAGGHVSRTELDRLDALLRGQQFALICLHHHPVDVGSRWLDTVGIDNAGELFEVIEEHRQVRALLWGHVHQNFDDRRRGVRLLATPSTCMQFLPLSHQFAVDGRPPAFRRLALNPDGTIDTDVVWVDAAHRATEAPPARTSSYR